MSRYNNKVTNCIFALLYSGPCMTVVLSKGDTGEGVIDEFRELLGPADVEVAKQDAPTR